MGAIAWVLVAFEKAPKEYRGRIFVYDKEKEAHDDLLAWAKTVKEPMYKVGQVVPAEYVGGSPLRYMDKEK